MKFILGFVLVVILIEDSYAIQCNATPGDTEARIKYELICNNKYDKSHKDKNTTQITNNFIIRSFDFDDDGILKLTLWVVMKWMDPRLKWNKNSYDNVDEIYEETDYIWIPQLNLYNEEIDLSKSNCAATTCILYDRGEVRCVFPCVYNGQCDADYADWPYDKQICSLMFGAWIHPGEHLNFSTKATTLKTENARSNYDWTMAGTWVGSVGGKYNSTKNSTYPSLYYAFLLERHSAAFTAIVTVPAMLCCAANLISFILDLFSTERYVMIVMNLLVHILHMQLLIYNVPHNGDTAPKIVIFVRDSLFLTGFLAIMTILLRSLNRHRGEMPNWLTTCHNKLSDASIYRVLLMNGAPAATVTSAGNQIEKIEQADDDGAVLVEMKKSEITYASSQSLWPTIALFVDRVLCVAYIIAYTALIFVWLPKTYTKQDAMIDMGLDTDK